jgi:hypothetical protein
MSRKVVIIFGITGIVCLIASLCILVSVASRFARVETQQSNLANAVYYALDKYTAILDIVEHRQTHLENVFVTGEQLRLTIEQLKAYNGFRTPQTVFVNANGNTKGRALGGGD